MSRKTKEEKITADARRAFYRYEARSQTPQKVVATTLNHNLTFDLKKTAILTSLIVATQIILFLALKNKVLFLPGITY